MKKWFILTLWFTLVAGSAFAKEPIRSFDCMISRIIDGDTIACVIKDGGGAQAKIRLYGIDAPETDKINHKTGKISKPGQPFGDKAEEALDKKIGRQAITTIDVMAVDQYKRLVGRIKLGNRDINKEMVAEGWAWAYRQYLDRPHASEYIAAEEQAREKKLGLWQQSNPQPPWEFRKLQKKRTAKHD